MSRLWKVYNKLKKNRDVVDSSMVDFPNLGGFGDLEGVVDLLLDEGNIIQLSKLKQGDIGLLAFSLSLVNDDVIASVRSGDGGEEVMVLKHFLQYYLQLSVSEKGWKTTILRDIASSMMGMQFDLEKEKIKSKESLDVS